MMAPQATQIAPTLGMTLQLWMALRTEGKSPTHVRLTAVVWSAALMVAVGYVASARKNSSALKVLARRSARQIAQARCVDPTVAVESAGNAR